MEIRPVRSLAEYRAAMAVNVATWRDAYADILPAEALAEFEVPDGETLRDWYEVATSNGRVFLVALDADSAVEVDVDGARNSVTDTGVVGFAAFLWDPEATKEFVGDDDVGLRAIYVHPERQGEGVGSDLLRAGLDRVPDDRERVLLEVFAANDASRAFYEARGFERVGASTFEVADDEYETAVYARELD